jgi:pimeloyl-ACP methyl ester carboxylesterase
MSKLLKALATASCWLVFLLCGSRVATSSALSHYERPSAKGGPYNERVIVFVHGIFGNADDTWRYPPDVYWPKLLLMDDAFKDTDIYVADYESPYLGNTMTVGEVAASLNNRLKSDSVFSKHREVILVCHSLGGIIVQELLLTHREYAKQVPFIYFFATPQTGSEIAKLGQLFSSDPLLEALLPGNENHYLENLEFQWKGAHFNNIQRYCAYEKKPLRGILVVDRLSGTRDCDELLPINEDHVSIVKPNTPSHDSYIALRNAVLEHPIPPKKGNTRGKLVPKDDPNVFGGSRQAKAEPSERAVLQVTGIKANITDGILTAVVSTQNVGKYVALPCSLVRVAVDQSLPLSPVDQNKLFDNAPFSPGKKNRDVSSNANAPNWQGAGIVSFQDWYPGDPKSMVLHGGPKFIEQHGLPFTAEDINVVKAQMDALKSGAQGWYILTRALFHDKLGSIPPMDSCTYFSVKVPNGEPCLGHND